MAEQNKTPQYVDTFVARQPLLDGEHRTWGYELLFRHSPEAEHAQFTDEDKATLTVAAGAIVAPGATMEGGGRKLLINFSTKSVLEQVPYALPSEVTAVAIPAGAKVKRPLADALAALKGEDYMVAVEGFSEEGTDPGLLALADIIGIDVRGRSRDELRRLLDKARPHAPLLLAQRVEEPGQFKAALEMGFNLFQGFFFQKPEIVPGRKLSSHEVSRLKLFSLIEKEAPDFQDLATTIQADVSISYRLLTYLNSPYFGFPQKITSIKQAILLLGWTKIRNWLRVMILTDLKPPKKSQELALISVQRGAFLEAACRQTGRTGCNPDSMFLLGLFSLLDVMLDTDMRRVMDNLALEKPLKDALCGMENEYRLWLDLTLTYETGDWEQVDALLARMGLAPTTIARTYYEAMTWSNAFFGVG